jgi:transcriptional regulator with XRE-family HTH domain
MDRPSEIRDFLTSRRAGISPERAGVPTYGGVRRVPGLRREELAHAAGVSVDYYNRLERGKATGVSPEILDAIARTLQLDQAEHEHLLDLFQADRRTRRSVRKQPQPRVRQNVQRVLDGLNMPAFVQNGRLDILAANRLGRALFAPSGEDVPLPFNTARFLFLDPRAEAFHRDRDQMARNHVAFLRAESGRDPHNPELINLIGQLSTQSEEFRQLWAAHDVRRLRAGAKRFHHPIVGDVEFDGESFELPEDPGLVLLTFTFEPSSSTAEAMSLLASWTAPSPRPERSLDTSHPDGSR